MAGKKPVQSSKALFRAMKAKPDRGAVLPLDLPEARAPESERRENDFYPTLDAAPVRSLISRDLEAMRTACGHLDRPAVWEPAVGDGALLREFQAAGFAVSGSDIVDRGFPGVVLKSFYDYTRAPAPVIVTNPPFCEINARDGHGRWLRHTLEMPGWTYCALLLSWDWPAAVINGLGTLLDEHPFTRAYLTRWKVDFTGEGAPPNRNAWFVWDRRDPRDRLNPPDFCFLNRGDDWRQADLGGLLWRIGSCTATAAPVRAARASAGCQSPSGPGFSGCAAPLAADPGGSP